MKQYIFLTSGIFDMGGAEMFTANKCRYLKANGWQVHVYFFRNSGDLKLAELKEYQSDHIPELLYGITHIPKNKREEIINRICEGIKRDDIVIIESHLINLSYWGELIAQKCQGKSIINAMEENFTSMTDKEIDFLEFKMKRMEILNAGPKTLKRYIGRHYKEEYGKYAHTYMIPYCSNVIGQEDNSFLLPDKGQSILSIGRLDKPYILPSFEQIKKYALDHPQSKFNLLIIGGSPNNVVEKKIKELFSGVKNLTLYEYGYMYPVPRNIVTKADVSIATSNSVLVSSNLGVPTIAIDIHDHLPIGIYGYTTNNKFSRTDEPLQSLYDLLQQILCDAKYPKTSPKDVDNEMELVKVFRKQEQFLSDFQADRTYYDVESVYPKYMFMKNQLKRFIRKLLQNNYSGNR